MVPYSMGDLFIEYGFCFRELETVEEMIHALAVVEKSINNVV